MRTPPADLVDPFDLVEVPDLAPRFNIAPTQDVATVVEKGGQRQLEFMHWGLVPSWADDPKIGSRMINARGETVATKPSFRSAFRRRRCLVLTDGFYEWKKIGKQKQPYWIGRQDQRPFAFAGLWERWSKGLPEGDAALESCTIITTAANELMRPLHERMPVILSPSDYVRWLDPEFDDASQLADLLVPYEGDDLTRYPVDRVVNNARNDVPECVEPIDETADEFNA